jgi:hypothetical protein
MSIALTMLAPCGGICLLPDWQDSKGAKIERSLAEASGKVIIMYDAIKEGLINGDYDKQ